MSIEAAPIKVHAWGREIRLAEREDIVVKHLEFFARGITSLHKHAKRQETLFISSGSFRIRWLCPYMNDYTELIVENENISITFEPNTLHQVEALTDGIIVETSRFYEEFDTDRVPTPRPSFEDLGPSLR
jgi:mannose-6-phosphate isomerase-like protein (cupin superfamily)